MTDGVQKSDSPNHFTIAAADDLKTFILLHFETGKQFEISRSEFMQLMKAGLHWLEQEPLVTNSKQ